jgi:hypothetical protein
MESEKPIDSIPISDLDLDDGEWEKPTKLSGGAAKFCFTIVVNEPSSEIKRTRHVLCAREESTANEWLESLLYAYIRCYRRRVQVPIQHDLANVGDLSEGRRERKDGLGPYDPMRIASFSDFSLDNFREYFPLTDVISAAKAEITLPVSHRHHEDQDEVWTPLCKVGPSRTCNCLSCEEYHAFTHPRTLTQIHHQVQWDENALGQDTP